ncbi:hypothetical protein NE236_30970 [Actinoallomurus purpureus]|uniref:hypothetical protein n=1 Tax=Actinoallomurus purpureus TaxID=478114 RepID=UPI0020933C56|nr:hypothetical protein [Actinoallomurus purpureus]MCO6009402.1 hypothetical protein [Actinoallomurus purpureus]
MGIDRRSTGSNANTENIENTENKPATERRPPPPPDRPGEEGFPSRADSRRGAAAANSKPETAPPAQETAGEQNDASLETGSDKPAASRSAQSSESSDENSVTDKPTGAESGPPNKTERADVSTAEGLRSAETATSESTHTDSGMRQAKNAGPEAEGSRDASGGSASFEGKPQITDKPETTAPTREQKLPETSDVPHRPADRKAAEAPLPERDQPGGTEAPPTGRHDTASRTMEASGGTTAAQPEGRSTSERTGEHGGAMAVEKPNDKPDPAAVVAKSPLQLTVDGKPLREVLDPVGAAAWSNEIGDELSDPADRAGDRVANTKDDNAEKDRKSRAEAFRGAFRRDSEKVADKAGKGADRLQDILTRRPPPGHQEARTGPDVAPAPHQGLDTGSAITTALVTGALIGEGIRFFHRRLKEQKGT